MCVCPCTEAKDEDYCATCLVQKYKEDLQPPNGQAISTFFKSSQNQDKQKNSSGQR
jgi:hypothetical protein